MLNKRTQTHIRTTHDSVSRAIISFFSWDGFLCPKGIARILLAVCIGWLSTTTATARAQDMKREYQIKAAFLFNFVKFIEWPANAFPNQDSHIILCVIGTDPFGDILDVTVNGKTAQGRSMEIRRLNTTENIGRCHILFVSTSEQSRLAQVMSATQGSSVLTVGEMARFSDTGGIINFILKRARIRFEINVHSARRSGLKISSKLLQLATIVKLNPDHGSD
ncbi:MAG: YfiR family protein [Nitrospiria bacterium]